MLDVLCCELLRNTSWVMFNNLYLANRNFDFEAVMTPTSQRLDNSDAEVVRYHVDTLYQRFKRGSGIGVSGTGHRDLDDGEDGEEDLDGTGSELTLALVILYSCNVPLPCGGMETYISCHIIILSNKFVCSRSLWLFSHFKTLYA